MPRRIALPALVVFIVFTANCLWAHDQQTQVRTGIWRGQRVTYQWIPTSNGRGKALYQGDILLDNVQQSPNGPQGQSLGVAYSSYLWLKGTSGVYEVPYIIDPASGDLTNLNNAITLFNKTFNGVIQLVAHNGQTDYVDFNFNASDQSGVCDAYEGRVGGEQVVGGSGTCTEATILHEMGHTVGVWHEQSRPDRDTYVTVNYGAVIKASRSNFDKLLDNDQEFGPYDYASVMEYPAYSFSRNGEPCIETIPAGIPLSNPTGYSAADIDGIDRLYGAIPSEVTVTSNPPGLQVIVDGATVITPQTYTWALNSSHSFNVPTAPQTLSGINYVYGRWSDSTTENHTITVTPGNNTVAQPATAPAVTVYSANFIQLVPYVNTISPAGMGTVTATPASQTYSQLSGSYYIIRQPVTLTAAPVKGQNFYNYINSPFWLPGGNGANPKTFNVMDDGTSINLTSYFTSSPVYTVTTNPVESNFWMFVDGTNTYWNAPVNFALPFDSSWTPSSTHSVGTYSPQYPWSSNTRFEFSSWNDGGAETHNVTLPSSGGATYTATLTPQYYVTDYALEACAGTINVTPSSPTGDGFYPAGSLLNFSETPNTGWILTGWLYDLSGTASSQNLTVNDEVLVAADYSTTSTQLQLTSISPPSIPAGGGPFTLTINGAGFTSSTAAYIGGIYRFATFVSSTQVTVQMTADDIATPGAFQVAVGNFPSGASCAAYVPTTFYVLLPSGGGTGTATLSPKSLVFGNQAAGTVSASKSVTLTNSGTGALAISSITASGDFSQTNNCSSSLASKSSCTINVTFNPTISGAVTGALTFTDGAATSPQLVKLTGTGVVPLVVSPTSLTFPSTAAGQTSSATVTLTNKQSTAITLSLAASADYSVTGGTCGSSLGAAASCTIAVTFAPLYKGSIKGALAITTNGAFSPLTVALSGAATGGATVPLTFSPATLTFSATGIGAASAPKTVTVTNKSAGSITINSIAASANYSAVGSGTSPCGGSLAHAATCTFSVTFDPSNTGSIKGSVALATSGAGSPQIVGLSGTGAIPVVVSPTSLAFTAQAIGSTSAPKTVTLTNNSGASLTISSILASGDFTAAASGATPCGATVANAATCTFSVAFSPNVKGAISGAATVSHSAPLGPAVIKLTGTGQ
jgi:hypothetical protein